MGISRRRFVVAGGTVVVAGGLAPYALAQDRRAPLGVWLTGDTHLHCDHSSDGSLPRQQSGQRLPGNLPVADQIGRAEQAGLDFVPLTDHRTYDQHWDPQWTSSAVLLIPGEEANGSPHAVVLGAVNTVVDGATPPGSPGYRRVQQSVWDAHAQDAVWSVAHPDNGELAPDGSPNEFASVQGPDTVEIWNPSSDPDAQIGYAEDRWNRGFRYGAVAGSDNHFREFWDIQGPGHFTTWVFAERLTERAVLDALRAGRTTVSYTRSGPFVTLEADLDGDGAFEAIGGDEIITRRRPGEQRLRVSVRDGAGSTLYVYASPGRSAGPVATFPVPTRAEMFVVPIRAGQAQAWYRAEVRAPGDPSGIDADPTLPDQLRAATSPIFVSTNQVAVPEPESPLPDPDPAGDDAAVVIGGKDRFAGFADVAVSDDVAHVVAEVHREGEVAVVYRQLTGLDRPGEELRLSVRDRVGRFPRVAASGREVWVVWQEEAPPRGPDVRASTCDTAPTVAAASAPRCRCPRATDGRSTRRSPWPTRIPRSSPGQTTAAAPSTYTSASSGSTTPRSPCRLPARRPTPAPAPTPAHRDFPPRCSRPSRSPRTARSWSHGRTTGPTPTPCGPDTPATGPAAVRQHRPGRLGDPQHRTPSRATDLEPARADQHRPLLYRLAPHRRRRPPAASLSPGRPSPYTAPGSTSPCGPADPPTAA
jgi:hypothetical protein